MKRESEATTLRGEKDTLRLVTVVIACFPFAGVDTSLPQQYQQTGEMAKFWINKMHKIYSMATDFG